MEKNLYKCVDQLVELSEFVRNIDADAADRIRIRARLDIIASEIQAVADILSNRRKENSQ